MNAATVILLLFTFYRNTDGDIGVGHTTVKVLANEPFIQKIVHSDSNVILNCYLQYKRNNSLYTIEIEMDKNQKFPPEIFYGNRLMNIGGSICGIKITEYRKDDPKEMTLFANHTGVINKPFFYEGLFSIEIIELPKLTHDVLYVTLGSKIMFACPTPYSSCTLSDPQGNEVEKACSKSIYFIAMNHIGNWTCTFSIDGSVEVYQNLIELRVTNNADIETWYKEEKGFGMIGCKDIQNGAPTDFCQFVSPGNEIYTIHSGSDATERYTGVGTDYEKSICQMEFKLPPLQEEIGGWKCILGMETGSYVEVPAPGRVKTAASRAYPKRIIMNIQLGNKLDIVCKVPYSTTSCFIKSPTGEYIYGDDENSFRLGECKTSVGISTEIHLGIWSCHISQPDSSEDAVIEIDVRDQNAIKSIYQNVDANEGQSLELLCEAAVPIQSCQFLSPSGLSFTVDPEKNTEEIEYVGKSLDHGDCGMRIKSARPEYSGVWTCVANSLKDTRKFIQDTARINVNNVTSQQTATAAAIGIPIAIAVVAFFMFTVVLYRRYRKKFRHDDARLSNDSNGVSNNTPIINIQMRNIQRDNN